MIWGELKKIHFFELKWVKLKGGFEDICAPVSDCMTPNPQSFGLLRHKTISKNMSLVSCWNHGPVGLLPPILFLGISYLHCPWVWPRDFPCPMEHSKHVVHSHWISAHVLGLALSY